jgi:[protein-PII] uridylyltransferase
MLITLVNSHYGVSLTAQKRNLDDTATIVEFANIVANRANLDALMLLTLADGQGTSDQNWSDWKEGLVWTLYRRTTEYLEGGRINNAQLRKNLEDLREGVSRRLAKDFGEEIEAHFEHMPERYFQMFDSEQVTGHIRLFRAFLEIHLTHQDPPAYAPVFKWIARPEQGHSEVWVCGWNRPRLLERIAGAFLSAQINILSADVFTRGDSLALDIFRVCSTQFSPVTSARDITRVETRLCDSLAFEDYDFSPLLNKEALLRTYRISQEAEIPTKIVVDNTSHPSFTLIDIQTPDRLGLLYDLLRALGSADINIELSRITTEMDVAMDTFYVTDSHGKITDESTIRRIQRLLQRASVRSVG